MDTWRFPDDMGVPLVIQMFMGVSMINHPVSYWGTSIIPANSTGRGWAPQKSAMAMARELKPLTSKSEVEVNQISDKSGKMNSRYL